MYFFTTKLPLMSFLMIIESLPGMASPAETEQSTTTKTEQSTNLNPSNSHDSTGQNITKKFGQNPAENLSLSSLSHLLSQVDRLPCCRMDGGTAERPVERGEKWGRGEMKSFSNPFTLRRKPAKSEKEFS
jgi:hypothetical protein